MSAFLAFFVFCIIAPSYGQNTTEVISGQVTGTANAVLSGATIKVKNGTATTNTDKEGMFFISAKKTDTLIVSFVGYANKEEPVNGRSNLVVSLVGNDKGLDEVIVVGYGTQRKVNLTGAVSTVSGKALTNRPVSTVANALQGAAPGLVVTRTTGTPGDEGIGIQIRGATSANGNVNPLLVVDGVTTPGVTLQTLNPNDIESISILKDAAAASIYGSQAAGGVILVTTKKGMNGKTIFEFSSLLGMDWALNLPKRLPAWEEGTLSNLARKNAGVAAEFTDEQIQWMKDGSHPYIINPADPNDYLYFDNRDFTKDILRDKTFMQTYNVSARGGNEKLNYYTSVGYYDKQGIFKVGPDKNDRLNIRLNLASQLTKHLSFDTRLSYELLNQDAPRRTSSGTNSNFHKIYRNSQVRIPIFTPEGRLNAQASDSYAIIAEGGYNDYKQRFYDGVFNLRLANFVKGLELRAVYGTQLQNGNREIFNRTINLYNRVGISSILTPNPSYTKRNEDVVNTNLQFLADYNYTFKAKNYFHLLAGYQFEDERNTYFETSTAGLVSNTVPALNLGSATATRTNADAIFTRAARALFGRFNYSYDNKYLFEATLRMDESSQLAPGLRRKAFPSLSAGWNMQRESWFNKTLPVFSEFKLRGSWGRLGNAQGLGYYDYLALLSNGSSVVFGTPETRGIYFFQNTVPASDLSWETVETFNGGVDVGMFKNKLQLSFDYYVKYNRNMLAPTQLPATFGVGAPRKNNGELKSWGWESELRYRDKIGKDFTYSIAFNLSDNQNKLLSYAGRATVSEGLVSLLEGYPLNSYFGFRTDGYFTSADEVTRWAFQDNRTGMGDVKYQDLDGSGRITTGKGTLADKGDLVFLGTNQPRFTFGFTLNVQWKGFDFTAFIQGVGKRSFRPSNESLIPWQQTFIRGMAIHRDYWTPENPNALFPRLYLQGDHNYRTADKWVLNGQYARLKNLQIGYTFPGKWLTKAKITSARIFFSGQDLLTVSALGGFKGYYDPENRTDISADYPFFGTASLGLNLSF